MFVITYIDSAGDIIACSVRGGFTSAEIDALVSKVERALETNARTHMFVEIDGIADFDWSVLAKQLPRGLAMLRYLDRFGRIAVVSDDAWIRLWTRAESALLPGISYELFKCRERDRAFTWVQGLVESPHAAALTIIPTDNPSVLAYAIDGSVTAADMDKAVAEFGPKVAASSRSIRVLAKVGALDFPNVTALIRDRYFDLKKDTLGRLERYAVVGGPEWLRRAVQGMAPVLSFEIRYFEPSEEAEAWQWIGASPQSQVTSAAAPAKAVA